MDNISSIKVFIFCVLLLSFQITDSCAQNSGGGSQMEQEPDTALDNPFQRFFAATSSKSDDQDAFGDFDATAQSRPPLFVKTVTLKFLDAKNLKTALDKMSSDFGNIAVNGNTNSLIICDTEENLEKMLAEVKQADQTPRQIMIEVVIIDVKLENDTEIGVDWDILSDENTDSIGDATAYMTIGQGGELSVISGTIRNVVNLLQMKKDVEILASPRVLVVSGQHAEIKTVEEIPYQEKTDTQQGGLLTSTEFKEVGVTLQVKATLIEDKQILMEIKPKQSVDTGVSIGNVPVVDTRQADTKLLMEDGQIVVMGGLRRKEIKLTKYQIPILGDLPLIGILFSNNKKVIENSELIVLISPHIYKGERVDDDTMAKFDEIRNRPMLSLPDQSERQMPDLLDE